MAQNVLRKKIANTVYYDTCLGAAHSKPWSTSPLLHGRVFTNFQKCYTRVCVNQGLGIKIYMAFLHQNLAKTCKTWKKEISTIVWSAQHQNMGQNLQKQSNTKIH